MLPNERFHQEWLEADGLGGFAMGTASGVRSRRYHALLQVATTPPTTRFTLVNGFEAWVECSAGRFYLSSQRYQPDVLSPNGVNFIESFSSEPWPRWIYKLPNGLRVQHDVFVPKGSPAVALSWKLMDKSEATLHVRPLLSCREAHAMHQENPDFRFKPFLTDSRVVWQPYKGVPTVAAITNARYMHWPEWYRHFLYTVELERGLEATEDLASPGEFIYDIGRREAVMIFNAEGIEGAALPDSDSPLAMLEALREAELERRKVFPTRLHRSADEYLVRRGEGKTIIAGYPWFTDWGRDTFISIRGLCLTTGRLEDAGQILGEWTSVVSAGMMPNLFVDHSVTPEYNSIDASLWFIASVQDFLRAADAQGHPVSSEEKDRLFDAVDKILTGYRNGTRFRIRMDDDGLIAGGVPNLALTWMDARFEGTPITPRIGKPVEIQALWLNALAFASRFSKKWEELFRRGRVSFEEKFWNADRGCLYDIIDFNHERGNVDASLRPNQVLAVGGLPLMLVSGERARRVIDVVENELWTPLGLRSLARGEQGYVPRYEGPLFHRDNAYHQGTVWPWLIGPFVEAWLNAHGRSAKNLVEARKRFLEPLLTHLDEAGMGHVSEITDAEAPYTQRGCPFQAWSVAEVLRLRDSVLRE